MLLQQHEIQNMFELGNLTTAIIYDDTQTLYNHYTLGFRTTNGNLVQLCTQRNNLIIKQYKSLKSAYQTIIKIGFKRAEIKQ